MTLVASEFTFDPAAASASAGSVEFAIRNTGKIEHNFELVDPKGAVVAKIAVIAAGATAKVQATVAAGAYRYVCTLPGHKEAGMIGALSVR